MPTFVAAFVGSVIALVLGVFIVTHVRTLRVRREELEAHEKSQREALRKAVNAGTHNERGEPLCAICGDREHPENVATEFGFHVVRDVGFAARAREMLGAPARYRIARSVEDAFEYCRVHAALALAELQAYLIKFEQEQRDHVLTSEVDLQHFERVGLNENVRTRVVEHEKKLKREATRAPAKVVPISR